MKDKNRALTPEAKREVLEALYETWNKFPELRLVQLILNVNGEYNTEDYILVNLLHHFQTQFYKEKT